MLLASVTQPRSMAMDQVNAGPSPKRVPWNKGKLTVQLLLGHTKIESTVRYLGIEVDDALAISEQVDV
jgi:hypothetical protein